MRRLLVLRGQAALERQGVCEVVRRVTHQDVGPRRVVGPAREDLCHVAVEEDGATVTRLVLERGPTLLNGGKAEGHALG